MSTGDGASGHVAATPAQLAAFDALVESRLPQWTQELVDYLAISSEGGDRDNLRAAADWTAHRLRKAGCAVEVLELGEHVPPLVVGELGDGPRTLASVGHYDVQPAAPRAQIRSFRIAGLYGG